MALNAGEARDASGKVWTVETAPQEWIFHNKDRRYVRLPADQLPPASRTMRDLSEALGHLKGLNKAIERVKFNAAEGFNDLTTSEWKNLQDAQQVVAEVRKSLREIHRSRLGRED